MADITDRRLTEIAVRGDYAYTGTTPRADGPCPAPCVALVRVWDLRPDVPRPILDVPVEGVFAGDAAVSDGGRGRRRAR